MKQLLRHFLAYVVLALACGQPARAVVAPEVTQLAPPGWMVNIYVVGPYNLRSYFCKGALISGRWVLTAARCLYDPYKALDGAADDADPEYVVIAAGTSTPVKVIHFEQSEDFTLGLMQLETPINVMPLALSARTEAALLNTEVQILATERSKGVRDSRYNPGTGLRMDCDIDGATFFFGSSATGGAFCYLMSRPETGSTLYRARARVIDPAAPGSPNSPLDVLGGFNRSGVRLYLDFRQAGSYPCHEDLGAPVLRTLDDGSVEAVGVVAAVGVAAGLPVCSPALYNTFASVAHYRDFIVDTVAEKTFTAQCPEPPEVEVAYPESGGAELHWDAVSGATGYKLHYTTREGYVAIKTADVGNVLEFHADLPPGVYYTVALTAYNATCSSTVSQQVRVGIDPA